MPLQITALPPLPPSTDKSHHNPSTPGYHNPWPSYTPLNTSPLSLFKTRFSSSRPPFIPVPSSREALPLILAPDFTPPLPDPTGKPRIKVTWLGHASFLLQCSPPSGAKRGVNILLDPVFADRTSPVSWFGPKRYTPPPCSLEMLCESVPVDVVCVSHNHYDHADVGVLGALFEDAAWKGREMGVVVGLGNGRWVRPLVKGSGAEEWVRVWEGDWWERIGVGVGVGREGGEGEGEGVGEGGKGGNEGKEAGVDVRITVTPSQHASRRGLFDGDLDLWCGFVIELPPFTDARTDEMESTTSTTNETTSTMPNKSSGVKLFFSGDTGYRTTATYPPPSASTTDTTNITNTDADPTLDSRDNSTSSPTSPPSTLPSLPSASTVSLNHLPKPLRAHYPSNPTFRLIAHHLSPPSNPITLSLLPIGLTKPRSFMSAVHADAWDSIDIHTDLRSKRSIGMHWGTVRGGLSAQYEDVRWPGREWRRACGERGLRFREGKGERGWGRRLSEGFKGDGNGEEEGAVEGDEVESEGEEDGDWEIGLMDVGESLVVEA